MSITFKNIKKSPTVRVILITIFSFFQFNPISLSEDIIPNIVPDIPPPTFVRGHCNNDRILDISDGVTILNYLF